MKVEKVLYRAEVHVSGGRDGSVRSPDGTVDLRLTTPRELGGAGGNGVNPEQLFASGYAACFLSAMKFVAHQKKLAIPGDASIDASVGIGPVPSGFGLEVELTITLPGMDRNAALALIDQAHAVCPYSNATRGNIEVRLTLR